MNETTNKGDKKVNNQYIGTNPAIPRAKDYEKFEELLVLFRDYYGFSYAKNAPEKPNSEYGRKASAVQKVIENLGRIPRTLQS